MIHRLWPSISEWFQRKLKAELEPELKKHLLDIVEFEETVKSKVSEVLRGAQDLGLGTSPMRLEGITSSMSSEEWAGEIFKTVKCVGDLAAWHVVLKHLVLIWSSGLFG